MRSPLHRILVAQLVVTLLASVALWFLDRVAACSALLGGLACVIPGLYLLVTSLRPYRGPGSGFGRVLKGEVGRIVITALILAWTFILVDPLDAIAFFGLFAGLQLLNAIVPALEARRLRSPPG